MFRTRRLDRGTSVGSVPELFSSQPNTIIFFYLQSTKSREQRIILMLSTMKHFVA